MFKNLTSRNYEKDEESEEKGIPESNSNDGTFVVVVVVVERRQESENNKICDEVAQVMVISC